MNQEQLIPQKGRDSEAWPLLTLLVGPVDSGKTTFLRNWYKAWNWGDGFLSVKRFNGPRLIGYDLEWLSTGKCCPWARVAGEEPTGWQPWLEVGPYRMFREGFSFASTIVDGVMADQRGLMILDEAGILELQGSGFTPLLEKLLAANYRTLVTVRDFCLSDFLSRFPAPETRVVQLPGKAS